MVAERIIPFLIVLLGLARVVQAEPTDVATIRLKSSTEVNQATVLLGDVATFEGISEEEAKVFSHLVFTDDLKPGETRKLLQIEAVKLINRYRNILGGARVVMPQDIVLRRPGRQLAVGDFEVAIQSALEKQLGAWGAGGNWRVKVSNAKASAKVIWEPGFEVKINLPDSRPRGVASFPVEILKHSEVIQKIWIQAKVEYWTKVAVAVRQIRAGQVIRLNEDVRMEDRDVTFLTDSPLTMDDLGQLPVSAGVLNVGTVLLKSQMQREIAARYGQEVEIVTGNDEFRVSARGIAEAQGYVGDMIKVKNATTQKSITGVLISKGVVKVSY